MSLLSKINEEIKIAMKSKDTLKLESLRAIKTAIILYQTSKGASDNPSYEEEIKILQRLVKQRKESASIFFEKGRKDLADNENAQALVISSFLPEQISDDQVEKYISEIILEIKANGMKDMGKVMGLATKKLEGKAEGKLIASLVKKHLST